MNEFADKYDWIGDYYQGVAIVRKGNKYGAISKEGEIVISVIYDELSDFVDGYTLAVYNEPKLWGNPMIYVKNRLITSTGQVLVANGNERYLLPKGYEWGSDFVNGLCIVVKDGCVGVINSDEEIVTALGKYSYIYLMGNGFIMVSGLSIETENTVDYSFLGFKNKVKEVCHSDWGLLSSSGEILLPCLYHNIKVISTAFSNNSNVSLFVWQGEKKPDGGQFNVKAGLLSITRCQGVWDAKLLIPIIYDDIQTLSVDEHISPTLINATKSEYSFIYDTNGILKFCYNNKDDKIIKTIFVNWELCKIQLQNRLYYITKKGAYFETEGGGLFSENSNGEICLLGFQYSQINSSMPKRTYSINILDLLEGAKVEREFLSYSFYELGDNSFGVRYNQQCGIMDITGNIVVPIHYNSISCAYDNCYISTIINEDNELRYGIIDRNNQILLPFLYCYIGVCGNYFVFSMNADISITNKSNMNSKYTPNVIKPNSMLGVMDRNYNIICDPKYNKIVDANKYCIKVEKNNEIGVINLQGNEILEIGECDNAVLMKNGFVKYALKILDSLRWGVIDYKGEDIFPCDYAEIQMINEEFFAVCSFHKEWLCGDKRYDYGTWLWGVVDTNGKMVLECNYHKDNLMDALRDKLKNNKQEEPRSICVCEQDTDEVYQGYNGRTDESIGEAFDGDPELAWNVD